MELIEPTPVPLAKMERTPRKSAFFVKGLKAGSPLLIGILPFAIIAGSVPVSQGVSAEAAMGFSLFIFAGASQLAALELIDKQAPIFIVILTVFMVNLRFLIYSAAIAPAFKNLPKKWKWFNSYLLTDQAFVLSHNHYEAHPKAPHRRYYFFGVATGLWTTWQLGTLAGVLVGAKVPPEWSLDFAIPLSFLALLVPNLKDKASVAAGFASGISVLFLASLPLNLGFIFAVFIGITAGMIVSKGGRS